LPTANCSTLNTSISLCLGWAPCLTSLLSSKWQSATPIRWFGAYRLLFEPSVHVLYGPVSLTPHNITDGASQRVSSQHNEGVTWFYNNHCIVSYCGKGHAWLHSQHDTTCAVGASSCASHQRFMWVVCVCVGTTVLSSLA
jgi:hypothetical protein